MTPSNIDTLIQQIQVINDAERQEAMSYAIHAFDLHDTLGHLNDGSYAPFVEACRQLALLSARAPETPKLVRLDNLEVLVDNEGDVYLGVKS